MITAICFKCSDGSRFTVKLNDTEYAPFFGVITAREHDDDPPVAFARFEVTGSSVTNWRGKYAALAKVIKKAGIYDRGIDYVTIERAFPYHADGFHKLYIAEKRITIEKRMHTKCWYSYARKTWKHKVAEQ